MWRGVRGSSVDNHYYITTICLLPTTLLALVWQCLGSEQPAKRCDHARHAWHLTERATSSVAARVSGHCSPRCTGMVHRHGSPNVGEVRNKLDGTGTTWVHFSSFSINLMYLRNSSGACTFSILFHYSDQFREQLIPDQAHTEV